MGEKTEKNIMYYMLISNNKQLKYREDGSAWECDILPRDNMSHPRGLFFWNRRSFSGQDKDNAPRAQFVPLYTYKS